ncbi:uncharacterized protein LOC123309749 [Coccinella septempunctata]|uniref:uncharacterized protein LOC123309749 n=1 Tax=Coccinella septempunctata TaxID=41139 RepID=UPI001D0972EF|nr:uncharacterized protein LOC123309749 [Coccinella septempunctata]
MVLENLKTLISPNFSNDDLIEMVKNYSNLREINIEDVIMAPPSQKIGDSYLSKILRFTINATGTNESGEKEKVEVNVITKVLPPNLGRRKTLRSHDFFENEIIFYNKVWSSMKAFSKSKGMNKEFNEIVPTLLAFCLDGENDYIALEDLSYKNFDSMERGKGIDYDTTMKVLNVFAKFHALSLAYKDQKPVEFSKAASSLKEVYFNERLYAWYGNFQQSLFDLVRDATKKELPQKYFEKIDKIFKDDFFKKTSDICENNHSHLSGVTQGDAWIPNFLFRKDEEALKIAIIDFQLARWAPFSNDITLFLFTCVEDNVLLDHWDDFINEYTARMKHYVKLLGSSPEIFQGDEFKEDIKKNIIYTLAMGIEGLSMSLIEGFDLDLIKCDEAVPLESVWVIHPFEDEERRKRVANFIEFLVDKQLI